MGKRNNSSQQEENVDSLVTNFKKYVAKYFDFLITEFGFSETLSNVKIPECMIVFRNATTEVRFLYEVGSVPGVGIARLEKRGEKLVDIERYSLDKLIPVWCPDRAVARDYEFGRFGSEKIEAILFKYSTILREYADRILKGDFSIFQELKKRKGRRRR